MKTEKQVLSLEIHLFLVVEPDFCLLHMPAREKIAFLGITE